MASGVGARGRWFGVNLQNSCLCVTVTVINGQSLLLSSHRPDVSVPNIERMTWLRPGRAQRDEAGKRQLGRVSGRQEGHAADWETLRSPERTEGSQAGPLASETHASCRLALGGKEGALHPHPSPGGSSPSDPQTRPVTSALPNPPAPSPCEDAPLPSRHSRCGGR